MAQRGAGKRKSRAETVVSRPRRGAADLTPAERIRELEAEIAVMKTQLASALAHNRKLEERQELVRNRIDWVIDSLHNMLEE